MPEPREGAPGIFERGRHTYSGPGLQVRTWTEDEKIVVGKYSSIGPDVVICTGGLHRTEIASTFPFDYFFLDRPLPNRSYRTTPTTTIGNDVTIGQRAMILNGAQVGDGAVVSAESVVFTDVPPYSVVAGNPAKILRYRFSKDVVESMLRIAWWDWPEEKVQQNVEWFYRPIGDFVAHFGLENSAAA